MVGRRHREFARFVAVSAVNTVIGAGLIFGAKYLIGLGDLAANAAGYAVGIPISYVAHGLVTFRVGKLAFSRFLLFASGFALAYGANLLVLILCLQGGFPPDAAQVLAIVAFGAVYFAISKTLVFRR